MTRRVVPSDRVFHLWAHQSQDDARNSRVSVSFRGADAYSYGTVIGRIVTNARGERAYLVSDRTYSVTTSGHQFQLRQSIPYGATVFHVDGVERSGWDSGADTSHAGRLQHYRTRIIEAEGKAKRARLDWSKASHTRRAAELTQEANAYCRFYDLAPAFDDATVNRLLHEQEVAQERARAEVDARRAEAERISRLNNAERAELWRNGENVPMWGYPGTLLRVGTEDGEPVVQTSRGASVPLYHARRLFRAWLEGKAKEGDRVGLYTVANVEGADALQIGCHYITRAEADRLAAEQGWTSAAATAAA